MPLVRLMENRRSMIPRSQVDNDDCSYKKTGLNAKSSGLVHGSLKNEKRQQMKAKGKCEKRSLIDTSLCSTKVENESEVILQVDDPSTVADSYSKKLYRAVLKKSYSFLYYVIEGASWLSDITLGFFRHEGVHDVVKVTVAVTLEVFVILVFAVVTILSTVLINIDEAYKKRRDIKINEKMKIEYDKVRSSLYDHPILKACSQKVRTSSLTSNNINAQGRNKERKNSVSKMATDDLQDFERVGDESEMNRHSNELSKQEQCKNVESSSNYSMAKDDVIKKNSAEYDVNIKDNSEKYSAMNKELLLSSGVIAKVTDSGSVIASVSYTSESSKESGI